VAPAPSAAWTRRAPPCLPCFCWPAAAQAKEYLRLIGAQTTISSNVFATSFFTLTGFHGLHVLVGLIMLSILAGLAWVGDFRGPRSVAVEAVSLYWHFVDAVWVVIFTVVYLWTWVLAR